MWKLQQEQQFWDLRGVWPARNSVFASPVQAKPAWQRRKGQYRASNWTMDAVNEQHFHVVIFWFWRESWGGKRSLFVEGGVSNISLHFNCRFMKQCLWLDIALVEVLITQDEWYMSVVDRKLNPKIWSRICFPGGLLDKVKGNQIGPMGRQRMWHVTVFSQ